MKARTMLAPLAHRFGRTLAAACAAGGRGMGGRRAMLTNVDFNSQRPDEFVPHHMDASPADMEGNGGVGRYFLVPGSAGRARSMAETFLTDVVSKDGERGHVVHLGKLDGTIDVGIVSTGMGCPSVDIIATELIKLGVKRMIRVGSCGSVQPKTIRIGSVTIATSAVKDESTGDMYAPREMPAVAHPQMVRALIDGAKASGLAEHTFAGPVHTKDSLYAREFRAGFRGDAHKEYMQWLESLGVIASEMEASMLFTLGSVYSGAPAHVGAPAGNNQVLAGTVCGVIGDDSPIASPEEARLAVDRAIQVALAGIRELHKVDTA